DAVRLERVDLVGRRPGAEPDVDAVAREPRLEVAGDPGEGLAAGRLQDEVHLPAEAVRLLEEHHRMAAPAEDLGGLHSRRAAADDNPAAGRRSAALRADPEAPLASGGGVDRAGDRKAAIH